MRAVFLVVAVSFVCLFAEATRARSKEVKITILGLNDLHGTIEARDVTLGNPGFNRKAKLGGVEIMGGYFAAARATNPEGTLILDAGDVYSGTLLSNYFQGQSIVAVYNALGIDASTFGNHEWDYGQPATHAILKAKKFIELSANVTLDTPAGPVPFPGTQPSRIFTRNGIKIGVVGATTVSTPKEANPTQVAGLHFKKLADTIPAEAEKLREDGADIVILVTHAGGRCDMKAPPEKGDEACAAKPADELTEFLSTVPKGTVDAVVAGHTHSAQAHFIRGVPVVQTKGFGTSFSRMDFTLNETVDADGDREVTVAKVEIRPPTYFCHSHFANYASCDGETSKDVKGDLGEERPATYDGVPVRPQASLATVLAPYQKKVAALMKRPIVTLPGELTYERTKESPSSNCIADTALAAAQDKTGESIDLFLGHSGGIRAGLPGGVVRYTHVYSVLPFDEVLAVAEITGEELERFALGLSVTAKSIAVISSGWTIKLKEKAEFPRHRGLIAPQGADVSPTKHYRVVTQQFNVLEGGPHDAIFRRARADGKIKVVNPLFRDLVADFWSRPGVTPAPACTGADTTPRTRFVSGQ